MSTITASATTAPAGPTSPADPAELGRPVDDLGSLLDRFTATEAAGYRAIALAAGGASVTGPGFTLSDSGSPCPFGNMSFLGAGVDAGAVSSAIAAFTSANDGGPYFVWDPYDAVDLSPGLARAGRPPIMVRGPRSSSMLVDGLHIAEVDSAERLVDFEHTLVEAYPAVELQPFGSQRRFYGDRVIGAGPWRLFVGYHDDRPVATAAAIVGDEVVAVEAVSTRPEHRGKGYGAALTDAAAVSGGGRPAMLFASDSGRPVYERLGFRTIRRAQLWIGTR